jgi:hypothetical protein
MVNHGTLYGLSHLRAGMNYSGTMVLPQMIQNSCDETDSQHLVAIPLGTAQMLLTKISCNSKVLHTIKLSQWQQYASGVY